MVADALDYAIKNGYVVWKDPKLNFFYRYRRHDGPPEKSRLEGFDTLLDSMKSDAALRQQPTIKVEKDVPVPVMGAKPWQVITSILYDPKPGTFMVQPEPARQQFTAEMDCLMCWCGKAWGSPGAGQPALLASWLSRHADCADPQERMIDLDDLVEDACDLAAKQGRGISVTWARRDGAVVQRDHGML